MMMMIIIIIIIITIIIIKREMGTLEKDWLIYCMKDMINDFLRTHHSIVTDTDLREFNNKVDLIHFVSKALRC